MADTFSRLQSLILSAAEVRAMTGWPEAMVSEWLNVIQNAALISQAVDSGGTDISGLEARVDQLEIDVDTLELAVVNLQAAVNQLQTDVSQLEIDVTDLRTDTDANTDNIKDLEQLIYIR